MAEVARSVAATSDGQYLPTQ